MANIETRTAHPLYTKFRPTWKKQRDTVNSEEHIKEVALSQVSSWLGKGCLSDNSIPRTFNQYLRPKENHISSDSGAIKYNNYLWRAKWYPFPLDTHDQALGMINNQPSSFELTPNLEYLEQDATTNQESLLSVLTEINSQQIKVSRIGMLGEVTNDPVEPFNIVFYNAENIVDWSVNIDEKGEEVVTWVKLLTDEVIDDKQVFLILRFDDEQNYIQYKTTNKEANADIWGVADEGYVSDSFIMPMVREESSSIIPFSTINLSRLGLNNVQKPWLESISDSALKVFQASATYKDALYWCQSTFYATGYKPSSKGIDKITLGFGGAAISSSSDAKFGFADAGAQSIEPNYKEVEALKNDCIALGVDLINQGVESGVALETRSSIKTASLKTLVTTGAEGLQRLLRILAQWVGDNPEDVKVIPNTEFSDKTYTAEELEKIAMLVRSGNFLLEDFYRILKRQRLVTAETFEEWDRNLEAVEMTGAL